MLIISAHLDRVYQEFQLSYAAGTMTGLLDNYIGVLLTFSTLFDDENLVALEKEGKIALYFNRGEEWGRLTNPPTVGKSDTVLCVDVWCPPKPCEFSLDNIWGFTETELKELREGLEWEGFNVLCRKFSNNKDEEDESWSWHGKAGKTLVFSIPIIAKEDGWHRQDCSVSVDTILRCRQGLKRTICYLL